MRMQQNVYNTPRYVQRHCTEKLKKMHGEFRLKSIKDGYFDSLHHFTSLHSCNLRLRDLPHCHDSCHRTQARHLTTRTTSWRCTSQPRTTRSTPPRPSPSSEKDAEATGARSHLHGQRNPAHQRAREVHAGAMLLQQPSPGRLRLVQQHL